MSDRNGREPLSTFQKERLNQGTPFGREIDLGGRLGDLEGLSVEQHRLQPAVGYVRHTGVSSDGETVTINGRVYEYDTGGVITGDVLVDISGGNSAAQSATALAAAINTDSGADVEALVAADTTTVILVGRTAETAFALAETLANGSVSAATMAGGRAAADRQHACGSYVVTAADVATWAAGGEVALGCMDDPGSAPTPEYLQPENAAGSLYSPAMLARRVVRVNADNYVLLLADPAAVLAAGDIVRWGMIA